MPLLRQVSYRKPIIALVIATCIFILLINSHLSARITSTSVIKPAGFWKEKNLKDVKDPKGPNSSTSNKPNSLSPECAFLSNFSNKDDVVIIVKTGATEAFSKIPTQLLTFLNCASPGQVFFFSDLEQYIGSHHIHDSLENVTSEAKESNSDFDLYSKQIEYKAENQPISLLAKDEKEHAWGLDKYKNTHIARKMWDFQPEAKWYLFIDADTYVVWSSLLTLLNRLNSEKRVYAGSLAMFGDESFAHGGSGYLISNAALRNFIASDSLESRIKWDLEAKKICCGDVVMGLALLNIGIHITSMWPMFNGEKPSTIPFGPKSWCQPLITMHHMGSEEVSDMWHLELHRQSPEKPLLIEDLNEIYMGSNIEESHDDWDNFSDDREYQTPSTEDKAPRKLDKTEQNAHKSFEDCGKLCKRDKGCYQWSYQEKMDTEGKLESNVCRLAWSFKIGEHLSKKEGVSIRSGWNVANIDKFKKKNSPCKKPRWVNG